MALLGLLCKAIKTMDQRFPANLEHDFQKSLEPRFAIPLHVTSIMVLVISAFSLFFDGVSVDDALSLFLAFQHICLILLSVLVIFIVFLRRWLRVVNLELMALVAVIVGLVPICFGGKWYAAQLFGRDPRQAFGAGVEASEMHVVMDLTVATVATCVVMPIRSQLLWVVPTFGTCLLCVVMLLTSSQFPDDMPMLLLHVCCVNCLSILAGFRNESHLRKEWLAERKVVKQIDISEKQKQAFYHLLDRLCDCLIHLGPDLTMVGPCRKLAAMLFFPAGRALQGNSFCDYISTREDRDRFIAAMGKGSSEEDPAGILPLHLKDSQNQEVQVHMYYTSFKDQDDSPHHFIGIVEASAERQVEQSLHHRVYPDCNLALAGVGCLESGTPSESDCYTESEGSVTLESATGSDLGEVSVAFKDDDPLTIVSCTAGFTSLCGSIGRDEELLDWIVDKDKFLCYVQSVGNRFLSIPEFEGHLMLIPPVASRAGIVYRVESVLLTAVTDAGHVDDSSESRLTLRITLSGIRLCRRRNRKVRRMPPRERLSQRHKSTSL